MTPDTRQEVYKVRVSTPSHETCSTKGRDLKERGTEVYRPGNNKSKMKMTIEKSLLRKSEG